jgi:membrane associated rhomboid family serine protease
MSGADLFVVCKNCGSEVSSFITECPYCGTRLRKRAPKLKGGEPQRPRRRRGSGTSLGRLRAGEIPGIRPDHRPWATLAIVVASVGLSLAWRAGAVRFDQLVVLDRLDGDWWRVFTAPFAYAAIGYQLGVLGAIALFGWLIERRHGPLVLLAVFAAGGFGGMLVAGAVTTDHLAAGGNGAAMALIVAWALPDLRARRRGIEVEGDLLGAGVFAAVILLLSLASAEADIVAALAGAAGGALVGLPLLRVAPA